MSVSIVIPAHNAAAFIVETLRAVLGNASVGEVLVVDDGSTDATPALVSGIAGTDRRVALIRCEDNSGAGVARNIGFAAARGEFTMFLDSDDFLVPGAIDEIHAVIAPTSADVGVYRYQYCRRGPDDAGTTHASEQRFWSAVPTTSVMHHVRFEQIGGILTTPNFPWNKIARTNYLRRIGTRFSETFIFNDMLGHWMTYLNAAQVVLYNRTLVYHRVDLDGPPQLSTQSNRRCLDVFQAFRDVEALFADKVHHKYYHYFLYNKLEILSYLVQRLPVELFGDFYEAVSASYDGLHGERLALASAAEPDVVRLSLVAKANPEEIFVPPSGTPLPAGTGPRRTADAPAPAFGSKPYWEERYRRGGNSGAGSHGRLAEFKASFINGFIATRDVKSMIEFGCGDGDQLAAFTIPRYVGIDVSETIVARCRQRFADVPGRSFHSYDDLVSLKTAEMAVSLDVIFHIVEDEIFERYMNHLFAFGRRYVVIYSSNVDADWPDRHVRHRDVTAHVRTFFPDWTLESHVPNLYPYDPRNPDTTSFSDFFVFTNPWSPAPHAVSLASNPASLN